MFHAQSRGKVTSRLPTSCEQLLIEHFYLYSGEQLLIEHFYLYSDEQPLIEHFYLYSREQLLCEHLTTDCYAYNQLLISMHEEAH